jgi:hypothetical protein
MSALDSAQSLSTLAADLFALDWDPATLAPFTGYSMYSAAATLLALTSTTFTKTFSDVLHTALPCLKLLDAMKRYWKHLERLVRHIPTHSVSIFLALLTFLTLVVTVLALV